MSPPRASPEARLRWLAVVVGALILPSAAAATSPRHHGRHHAKAATPAATHPHGRHRDRHAPARLRPGAKPDVLPDLDLAGGGTRHGCAAPSARHDELLAGIGVHDPLLLQSLDAAAPEALAAPGDCVPYALTVTGSGAVRAFGLRLAAHDEAGERLYLFSRAAAGAELQARSEDVASRLSDVATVTTTLQEVATGAAGLQAAVPPEVLHGLTALVPLLHAAAADDDPLRYLVRASYGVGEGIDADRLLSVEILERDTGDVVREALWVARDGLPGGYFAPDGTSFEHALWTSPVSFTRISRGIGNFRTTIRRPVTRRSGHKTRIVMARSTRRGTHVGIDFAAPIGAPVVSVADGRVVDLGLRGGYGNLIVVEHGGGYTTRYAHLSGFAPDLEIGSEVRRGSEIGFVGSTGFSTGPHLHFEIRRDGIYLDPLDERLAFGLWSMRPVDYLPMLRQTLLTDATDRVAAAAGGTLLLDQVISALRRPAPAELSPLPDHSLAGNR